MFLAVKVTIKLTSLFFAIFLTLPFFLYRAILSSFMSYFFSLTMVEARSSYFLAEDFYSQNSYTSMILLKLEGRLDVPQLRQLVEERLINSSKYPELSSTVVYRFGYMFWKKDLNFNLNRHVFDLADTSIQPPDWMNPNEVDILAKNIMRCRTWTRNQPLWEILVANENVDSTVEDQDSTSFFIVKYHHSLCDGYAAYNVLGHLFGKTDLAKAAFKNGEGNTRQIEMDGLEIMKKIARVITKAPVQIWKYFIAMEGASKTLPVLDATSNDFQVISLEGPLQSLRNAKRKYGIDFNSVYIAGITAFYRRLLQVSGRVFNENANLGVTILMPGHTGKLRNNAILLNIVLPLGESDPYKRLQIISQQMKTFTKSYVPSFIFFLVTWLGTLPYLSLKFLRSRRILTTSPFVATNLGGLGQEDVFKIKNCNLHRWIIVMNYPFDGPGFKIGLISCRNKINISTSVKSEFLPESASKERMEEILGECFREWDSL